MAAGERVNICDREVKPALGPVHMSADWDTVSIPWHVKHQAFPPHTPTARQPCRDHTRKIGPLRGCHVKSHRRRRQSPHPTLFCHPPPPPAGPTAIQSGTSPIKRKNGFPYATRGRRPCSEKLTLGSLIPAPEARPARAAASATRSIMMWSFGTSRCRGRGGGVRGTHARQL